VGVKPEVLATQYFRLAGGTVPVNLERLCRRLRLNIVEWPGQPDFTSLLSVLHRMIVVNKNMIYVRRRFSVAHELGHYALGEAGVQFFGERGRVERAANRFAAALLMPNRELRRSWNEYGCNAGFREDILSDIFVVSAQALRVRLERLFLK
jgi:Zn-dependent peptidase ImmA (M78 family)